MWKHAAQCRKMNSLLGCFSDLYCCVSAHLSGWCRKFDASDFKSLVASGLAVLSEGVPSVGGFLAGFALGLR